MSSNKPTKRLADVTKKTTTDRASMLATSFIPKAPSSLPASTPTTESEPVSASLPDSSAVAADQDPPLSARQESKEAESETANSGPEVIQADKSVLPGKERTRRSSAPMELKDIILQAPPEGVRFTHMIMLCDDHHEMMRELAFRTKKPMTQLMFNLLEVAQQTLQRENKKGN